MTCRKRLDMKDIGMDLATIAAVLMVKQALNRVQDTLMAVHEELHRHDLENMLGLLNDLNCHGPDCKDMTPQQRQSYEFTIEMVRVALGMRTELDGLAGMARQGKRPKPERPNIEDIIRGQNSTGTEG
jgi:hypothetical protein